MSIANFPQEPFEPNKKNQPQKAPSIDEPTPNQSDQDEEDIGIDEGILNAR